MKYIVYKTTNKINKKIYIGVHLTENPDINDGYIGCGVNHKIYDDSPLKTAFQKAVLKYGYENFEREILYTFDGDEEGREAAYTKEAEIVTKDFIRRKDNYNMTVGGHFTAYENLKKKVNQYTLEGKFIRTWESISDAVRETGIKNINSAVIGSVIRCGGYQWGYYEGNTDDIPEVSELAVKVVYQFTLTGKLIKVWDSTAEAAMYYGVDRSAIQYCCHGKSSQCLGFYWSYENAFNFTKCKHVKAVACYDDNGFLVEVYPSIRAACDALHTGFCTVRKIVGNKEKRCRGFRLRYFEGDTSNIEPLK